MDHAASGITITSPLLEASTSGVVETNDVRELVTVLRLLVNRLGGAQGDDDGQGRSSDANPGSAPYPVLSRTLPVVSFAETPGLTTKTVTLGPHEDWVHVSSTAAIKVDAFATVFEQWLGAHRLPVSTFMRFFGNNKPLPFALIASNRAPTHDALGQAIHRGHSFVGSFVGSRGPLGSSTAGPSVMPALGALLRVPTASEPVDTSATTLREFTSRLVIIALPWQGLLMTYWKLTGAPFVETVRSTMARPTTTADVVLSLTREALKSFSLWIQYLWSQLEEFASLPDMYKPREVVGAICRIQRQSSVMAQSLRGNKAVVAEIHTSRFFGEDLADFAELIVLCDELLERAEELERNASDALQLRLSLVDFSTQRNLRIFSYFTVITQPITLIAGWFGMNFPNMWFPDSYLGLVAFTVTLVAALSFYLRWLNDPHRVPEHKTFESVLRNAPTPLPVAHAPPTASQPT